MMVIVILLAIIIPRLRIVTRERELREAARAVRAMIAAARDDAVTNRSGGILFRRNTNFVHKGSWYASTELGILRAVPDYVGDQVFVKGAFPRRGAFRASAAQVEIPYPIEQEDSALVQIGDSLSLNHSSAKFEITAVEQAISNQGARVLRITLDVGVPYPSIPLRFDDAPFVIQRRPRLKRSSLTEIPGDHLVDLRFSGFDPVFEPLVKDVEPNFRNYEIEILFEKGGYLSRFIYWELTADNQRTGRRVSRRTTDAVFLLVTDAPVSSDNFPLAAPGFWVRANVQPSSPVVEDSIRLRDRQMSSLNNLEIADLAREARGGGFQEASP